VPVLSAGAVVSGPAPIPGPVRAVSVSTEYASPFTVAGPGEVRVMVDQLDALSLLQSVITQADEAPGISDEQLRDRLIALTDRPR